MGLAFLAGYDIIFLKGAWDFFDKPKFFCQKCVSFYLFLRHIIIDRI